jgi:protein-disulfide isomerase/uncharacterized membrane protein
VTASKWNRICIALSFAGLFVAGYLSLSTLIGAEIPCMGSHACDIVQQSKESAFFGIKVAYLGFLAYVVLAVMSILRGIGPEKPRQVLTKAGLAVSGIGTLFSIYLIYTSITSIHQTCIWCIGSATIMTLLFFSHGFLSQMEYHGSMTPNKDFIMIGVLSVLVLAGFGFRFTDLKAASVTTIDTTGIASTIDQMVPKDAHVTGPKNAHIIIVEFGDLICPHCKEAYEKLHQTVAESGEVDLVFRQFPLYNTHPMAVMAATISEMAAEKGKFWDYLDLVYGSKDQDKLTTDDLVGMGTQVGLNSETIQKRLQDPKDPALLRVQSDLADAMKLKIKSTPTFFWGMKGTAPSSGYISQLRDAMGSPPYSHYVKAIP